MIGDFIILIATAIITVISFIFSGINFVIPQQIPNAFNTFFSYVRIGDGIFPFSDALLAIGTVLTVWVLLYIVKVTLFGFSILPWIGKVVHLPQHKDSVGIEDRTGTITRTSPSGQKETREFSTRTIRRWEK